CLCGELLALAPLLHLCYRKENRQAYQLERAFGCTTHPLLLSHSLSLSLCLSPLSPPSLSLSLPLPLSALPSLSLSLSYPLPPLSPSVSLPPPPPPSLSLSLCLSPLSPPSLSLSPSPCLSLS